MTFIASDWPAPKHIIAGVSLRSGGISQLPYASNNLALHVGDNEQSVMANREVLNQALPGQKQWQWLDQVHGTQVVVAPTNTIATADACYTSNKNTVCTVLTADCLPILLCDSEGREVAAIHAGWRSLCGGIIENTVSHFNAKPSRIVAWLGPAIGPSAFEVGNDVVTAFVKANCGELSKGAFAKGKREGKYMADIYQLARIRLQYLGVTGIYGGNFCTVTDTDRFYSYRRDGVTGRMVSFIYSSSPPSQT